MIIHLCFVVIMNVISYNDVFVDEDEDVWLGWRRELESKISSKSVMMKVMMMMMMMMMMMLIDWKTIMMLMRIIAWESDLNSCNDLIVNGNIDLFYLTFDDGDKHCGNESCGFNINCCKRQLSSLWILIYTTMSSHESYEWQRWLFDCLIHSFINTFIYLLIDLECDVVRQTSDM